MPIFGRKAPNLKSQANEFDGLKATWSRRARSGDYEESITDPAIVQRLSDWEKNKADLLSRQDYSINYFTSEGTNYCSIFLATAEEAIKDRYVYGDPADPYSSEERGLDQLYAFLLDTICTTPNGIEMPECFVRYRLDVDSLLSGGKIRPTYDVYREAPFDRVWLAADTIKLSGMDVPAGETFTRSDQQSEGAGSLILGEDMVYMQGKPIATVRFREGNKRVKGKESGQSGESISLPAEHIVNRNNNLVYVIMDLSGSMNEGGRLSQVQMGLRSVLGKLPDNWDLLLRTFQQEENQLYTGSRNNIMSRIAGFTADGGTPLYDAVGESLRDIRGMVYEGPFGPEVPTVHLFIGTDGGENSSKRYSVLDIQPLMAAMLDSGRVEVHPFTMGSDGEGVASLQNIVGDRMKIKEISPGEVAKSLSEMIGRVHTQHRPNMVDLTKKKSM